MKIYIHSIVNLIAEGKSDARVYLILIYGILFILLSIFPRKKLHRKISLINNNKNKIFDIKFIFKLLTSLIVILYTLGLASYFYYVRTNHLSWNTLSVLFNNNENTSNIFSHNHVLKSTFAPFVQYFNPKGLANYDPGIAFIGVLPNFIGIASATIFLCIFILIIYFYLLINIKNNLTENFEVKKLKFKILFGITYFLTSFTVLDTLLDGGIFSEKAIISLVMFISINCVSDRKNATRILRYLAPVYFIQLIFLYYFEARIGQLNILQYASSGIVYFLIIFTLFSPVMFKKWRTIFLASFILAIYVSYNIVSDKLVVLKYMNVKLPPDGAIAATYDPVDGLNVINRIGDLNIYKIYPDQFPTIGDFMKKFDFKENFFPVSVNWVTCLDSPIPLIYRFKLNSERQLNFNDEFNKLVNLYDLKIKTENVFNDGIYKYGVNISLPRCIPSQMEVIRSIIRSGGLEKFNIYDINLDYGFNFKSF